MAKDPSAQSTLDVMKIYQQTTTTLSTVMHLSTNLASHLHGTRQDTIPDTTRQDLDTLGHSGEGEGVAKTLHTVRASSEILPTLL